jgi:tRNA (guanosine-2'-O-)-methyltransferase
MTPERLQTIKNSLNRRQPDLTVVMENVRKPHNLAAVARTLEAIGGMQIHAISSLSSIRLSQMAAGGIGKWISVRKYATIEQGLQRIKQQGHRIIATTLSETSKDYRDIDYTVPTAILVGEELDGISTRAIELADETITIPIVGMVQSLNVSVASALVLYEAYRQREQAGMYQRRALDNAIYMRLLFEACHPQVAKYCREKAVEYPAINDDAELLEPVTDSKTYREENFSGWIRKMKI